MANSPTNSTTVVTYDVAKAIAEIERLNAKVAELEKKSTKSFESTGSAASLITKGLGSANPSMQTFITYAGAARDVAGALSVSGGLLAAAGLSIVAGWIDLPEIFRSTSAQLEIMNKALLTNNELSDSEQGIRDNFANSQAEEAIERIRLRQAEIREEQAIISEQREGYRDRLDAARDYYKRLDSAARASAREREKLEDRVNRLREDQFIEKTSKLPANQQINQLIERATQQRNAGNFDAAERLLDKAKDVAKDSGNAFNQNRVSGELDALITAIDTEAKKQGEREAAINKAKAAVIASTKADEAATKALEKKNNELSREQKFAGSDARQRSIALGDDRQQQAADELARDFETNRRRQDLLARSSRSATEGFFGGASSFLRGFADFGDRYQQALDNAARVRELARQQVQRDAERLNRGGATPRDVLADASKIRELEVGVASLRATPGGVPSTIEREVKQLEDYIALKKEEQKLAQDFVGQNRGLDTPIAEGSKEADLLDQNTAKAGANIEKAAQKADALDKSLGRAASHQIGTPGVNADLQRVTPGLPAPGNGQSASANAPRQIQQTVNANINVRGGMLDPETIQQISERVAREIRKGTVA